MNTDPKIMNTDPKIMNKKKQDRKTKFTKKQKTDDTPTQASNDTNNSETKNSDTVISVSSSNDTNSNDTKSNDSSRIAKAMATFITSYAGTIPKKGRGVSPELVYFVFYCKTLEDIQHFPKNIQQENFTLAAEFLLENKPENYFKILRIAKQTQLLVNNEYTTKTEEQKFKELDDVP